MSESATKTCTLCKVNKPIAEFYPSSRSENHVARCKKCCRINLRLWRARNRIGKPDKRFKEAKTEKACRECQILKPISDFSTNRSKNRMPKCKKCQAIFAREWRAQNPEKAFAIKKTYNSSPAGKLSRKLCFERYAKRHPERRRAIHIVEMARKSKRLEREPCVQCGASSVEAHHADYSKPLSVTWLCRKHHIELHTEQNKKQLCS